MSISSAYNSIGYAGQRFLQLFSKGHLAAFDIKMQELKQRIAYTPRTGKQHVVISGAGPAGLIRAIQSLMQGNPTIVIEKRSADCQGRDNVVALKPEAVVILNEYGIYDFLVGNGYCYSTSNNTLTVKLGDLENAMKVVLSHLSKKSMIQYNTQIEEIHEIGQLTLKQSHKKRKIKCALLVNAEGASSTTNALLQIARTPFLKKLPVVEADRK